MKNHSMIVLCVIALCFFGCSRQKQAEQKPQDVEQKQGIVLDKAGDIQGFQTGNVYVLSVEHWGNRDGRYADEAFKKFHSECEKLAKDGWNLDPQSVQISQHSSSAWIAATFKKK